MANDAITQKGITLSVARFDKWHPVVSGNKIFKLSPFLEQAMLSESRHLISFGGAYSNHLVAMAFACQGVGLQATGIVRGEKILPLNDSLRQCKEYGMHLEFVSREEYRELKSSINHPRIQEKFGEHILVPEGGFDPLGAKGAMAMYDAIRKLSFDEIVLPIGTGTTLAGFLMADENKHRITGISALKGMIDLKERLQYLTGRDDFKNLSFMDNYHFGGFGKYDPSLIDFMNQLHETSGIETDFVYTAKMIFAVIDLIHRDYFSPGSRIICIHTGGLQGNNSISDILSF